MEGHESYSTADMPCSSGLLFASEASSCVKRSTSSTDNSWATCLGRPVREGFTLATARLNETRRRCRTVKGCRARVARLTWLKMLFDTHSGRLLHRPTRHGPIDKGAVTAPHARSAGAESGIARNV